MKPNEFIDSYIGASNAASGSLVDSNANVTNKTMASLEVEMYKKATIEANRERLKRFMDPSDYEMYLEDLKNHVIYCHDESSLKPYCASISLYPFLLEGTKCVGGVSGAPKNLQSFCGSFVNFLYQVAGDFAGAVATVEFLHYFDYFARKTYGADYLKSNSEEVFQELQGVIYAMNQPASARGAQSVFWNISVFDKPYFDAMFGEFYYPDGSQPYYNSVRLLQDVFMNWFREERTKELLTFPVVTASHLTDGKRGYVDELFLNARCEDMANGLSFFVYASDSADSLASCCRLRNELADNTFSHSLGAGGVVTGSAQVITVNLYAMLMEYAGEDVKDEDFDAAEDTFFASLVDVVGSVHLYLLAHKAMYKEYVDAGLLPTYTAGVMDIDKQFLTIGLNGIVEAAEALGYIADNNWQYKGFLAKTLGIISALNKEALKETGVRFNTEFVPAENLGVKNAKWDKRFGRDTGSKCYNSYFYRPEDASVSILDKIALFGEEVTKHLDGGSALHLNLEQILTKSQARMLYEACAKKKVPYWTFNVLSTCCNDCGYIDPETNDKCSQCGSSNVDYATRIIGYLKRISNFSEERQVEAGHRYYNINHTILGGK